MSRPDPDISQCCAVIVTWQPEMAGLHQLVGQLVRQRCPVFLIDNGSTDTSALQALEREFPDDVTLHLRGSNTGLAAALNAGVLAARTRGCRLVWLFDQDSRIGADFCPAMLGAWRRAGMLTQRLAALGPRLMHPETHKKTPFVCFRWLYRKDAPVAPKLYETDFLITSGSLLSLAAISEIGMMKESYFIDNIDLEWCFRARAKGFELFGCDDAVLLHSIGEASRNPLVTSGLMVQHSPQRLYYSTRNRLHLRRQSYVPADWKWRDLIRLTLKSCVLLVFSARRRDYWQNLRRGIKDAGSLQ